MANRDAGTASASNQGEKNAEPRDVDSLGGPSQNSKTSLPDCDPSEPVPSNDPRRSDVPSPRAAQGIPDLKGRRKILIVDDESAIADTLQLIFLTRRYEVRVAYTAERAVEVIAEWQPDMAVVDVILPEMNGIDLAIVIKENYPSCHVLLFSG